MLIALVAAGFASCASAAGSHGPGAVNFEWAGIFTTDSSMYMWTAQKVKGKYADATMKLAALPTSNKATDEELHRLEDEGKHALEETCIEVHPGGTITPKMDTCYNLHYDNKMWQSLFKIDATKTSTIAFFAQHVPTEFEATAHYLKDGSGEDIEPVAQLPEEEKAAAAATEEKPWGATIGASVIVQIVTLVGVIFAVKPIKSLSETYSAEMVCISSGFAAGALLSCTFYLLLFEATHLVGTGWKEEVDVLWRWGTMILAGMFLPGLVDLAVTAVTVFQGQRGTQAEAANDSSIEAAPDASGAAAKQDSKKATTSISTKARLLAGVLIGDFFHNLCDGFFVGAAFKGCGSSFGWGVALATVLHEIPQEIADYMILTGPDVKLSTALALFFNFLSGLSVMIGAIVVLSVDVSDSNTGLLLAFGGGVYLHIAAVECMPRMYSEKVSLLVRVASTTFFVVGAVLIGLVLLDHEHCVPAAAGGGGGGHHH